MLQPTRKEDNMGPSYRRFGKRATNIWLAIELTTLIAGLLVYVVW